MPPVPIAFRVMEELFKAAFTAMVPALSTTNWEPLAIGLLIVNPPALPKVTSAPEVVHLA